MKRWSVIVLVLACLGITNACGQENQKYALNTGSYYTHPDSEAKKIYPYINLYDDNEFYFMDDVANSKLILGEYSENNGILTLSCENEEYCFVIKESRLIFQKNISSEINLADGTVFYYVP